MTNPWIQTYTGKAFDLLDPQPEQVDILDIAHALSNICRFTGHCRAFYSVAQHSCLVARIVVDLWRREHGYDCPEEVALVALLHDAPEAYIGDVSTPLKRAIRVVESGDDQPQSGYDWVTARVERAIEQALLPREAVYLPAGIVNLNAHVRELVKRADLIALSTEHAQLFSGPPPRDWGSNLPPPWGGYVIEPWAPAVARVAFLQDFRAYGGRGRR